MKQSPLTISSSLNKELQKYCSELAQSSSLQYRNTLTKRATQSALADSASSLSVYTGKPPEPSLRYQQSLFASRPAAFTVQVYLPLVHQKTGSITDITIPILTPDGNISDAAITL